MPRTLAAALLFLSVPLAACSMAVEGDTSASYGEVTLTVTYLDGAGNQVSRDERRGAGDELVAPLDRELHDPIAVDGEPVSEPALLLDAARVDIELPTGGVVTLTRQGDSLLADGPTLLGVRAARRTGDTLAVEVDGGRFDIELTGAVSDESRDRFLATAVVRLVRGEALLADDCRPDCIYSLFNPVAWLCGPMRDILRQQIGGECAGPITPEEWDATVQYFRTEGKRDTCYQLWLIPRPICEVMYDVAVDGVFEHLRPDASGNLCAEAFYQSCSAELGL